MISSVFFAMLPALGIVAIGVPVVLLVTFIITRFKGQK